MPSMLYNADDIGFITEVHTFFSHIAGCGECQERALTDEGRSMLTAAFDKLNDISLAPIAYADWTAAVEFAEGWLEIHDILGLVKLVPGSDVSGTVQ